MGVLIEGKWTDGRLPEETSANGAFLRAASAFRGKVTADGSSGFKAEPGRYHLYVMLGCPWAHRTLLYRAVKKLEPVITVDYALPHIREEGWTYGTDPLYPECTPDTIHGFRYLHQLYTYCEPRYTGKVTVPVLFDKKTSKIVNNESSEIIRMLNTEFKAFTDNQTDYYPQDKQVEIDRLNALVYHNVNNGVYRCGFAQSQKAYEEAFDGLFSTLDEIEKILERQRYLAGNTLTEADLRLFPTLARFDVAYYSLFKCNLRRIADYPNISNYMRDIYAQPGVASTVNARQYIANYYSIDRLNPPLIVPKGTPVDYTSPHDRSRFH